METGQGLIHLLLFLLWNKGLVDGSDVTQPALLWKVKGDNATIDCKHTKGAGYFQMYWYRQLPGKTMEEVVFTTTLSKAHDFGTFSKEKYSATKVQAESGTFTVKNLEAADTGLYFCAVSRAYEAYFGSGTKLTVLEPDISVTAPTVTLLRPSPKECRNEKDQKRRKKTLVCLATGFYPDHIDVSWLVNDESVTDGVATDSAAQRPEGKKFYKISSRLRVAAEVWFNPDSVFTCQVSFFNGSGTENFTESIQGEAIVSQDVMTRDSYLKISQAAKLSYSIVVFKSCIYGAFVVFLVWKLQGRTGKQNF